MAVEESKRPMFADPLTRWWRRWRDRRAALAELATCSSEVATIAQDLGVTPADLRVLAAKRPDAADLLSRRLAALQLDANRLGVAAGPVLRDLQRLCTMCDAKAPCAKDLARHSPSDDWQGYCPNSDTLKSLAAADEERRALARIERHRARLPSVPPGRA